MTVTTKTDTSAIMWRIDDDLIQLRVWGTDIVHRLPAPPIDEWTIGTGDACALRIVDTDGLVSRQHCQLTLDNSRWMIRDLASKNGTFVDGSRREASVITPGVEIQLGKVTLLAESQRLIELRGFLGRLLGYGEDRVEVVDHALRAVRLAATRRAALVLCGDGDLVPIALDLHRRVLGPDRPFVSCDPRRRHTAATVRSVENYAKGLPALEAAKGGALCVWSNRLPRDFNDVTAALRNPSAQTVLVVVAHTPAEARSFVAAPIAIPSLRGRGHEIGRIIEDYAAEALADLSAAGPFTSDDREWVRAHSADSFPEIEKGTRRVVALRHSESIAQAAALLGMAPASLQEWIGRRSLPSTGTGSRR